MTNPHTIAPTGVDIRASADRVIAQFQQRQHAEALWLLERERADERPAVQEALDAMWFPERGSKSNSSPAPAH